MITPPRTSNKLLRYISRHNDDSEAKKFGSTAYDFFLDDQYTTQRTFSSDVSENETLLGIKNYCFDVLTKESIRFEILTAINTDNTSFMLTLCLLKHAAPQGTKPNHFMHPLYP